MSGAKIKSAGATRGQLALVGVLALVLVGVIGNNLRGAAEEPAAPAPQVVAATSEPAQPRLIAAKPTITDGPFGEFAAEADWPEPSLEQLVNFDPFAPPASVAVDVPGSDSTNDSLRNLSEAKDAIIFVTGNQRVARIGETEYHVGDAVGRFRITEISSAGIVLSEPVEGSSDR
jgi:hypothetical protein